MTLERANRWDEAMQVMQEALAMQQRPTAQQIDPFDVEIIFGDREVSSKGLREYISDQLAE